VVSEVIKRKDMAGYLAERFGFSLDLASQVVDELFGFIIAELLHGKRIALPRLGYMQVQAYTKSKHGIRFVFRPSPRLKFHVNL